MLSSARAARICAAVIMRDPRLSESCELYEAIRYMHYVNSTITFNAHSTRTDVNNINRRQRLLTKHPAAESWAPELEP
jgi:hypothetical protein